MIHTFGYSHPELPRVDVPVGKSCTWCTETFVEDDIGVIIPYVGLMDDELREPFLDQWLAHGIKNVCGDPVSPHPYHRNCFVRQIVGSVAHQRGTCSCHGGQEDEVPVELSARQEAAAAVVYWRSRSGDRGPL